MRIPVLLATLAGFFSLASSIASAQILPAAAPSSMQQAQPADEKPKPGDGKSPDDVRFLATVYAWAVNLSGTASARGNTVNINATTLDIIQKSNSLVGFMGDFEADKGRFGFYVDVVWAQLGIPASAAVYANPIAGVKLSLQANAADTMSLTVIEAAGLYEIVKWQGSDQTFTAFDFYAGGRFWNLSNQLDLDLTGAIAFSDPRLSQFDRTKTIGISDSGSLSWVDPMVGIRFRHQFAPNQHLMLKGDVGGFGLSGSSQFSWQAEAVYSYSWQFTGYALAADIGFRALSTNVYFNNPNSPYGTNIDLAIYGPLVGLTVRF